MSEIHPFLFLLIAEFALFVALLLGASLWNGVAAKSTAPTKPARAVVVAKSPTGPRARIESH